MITPNLDTGTRAPHGRANAQTGGLGQIEYIDQTPRRPRRTPQAKAAEDALGHHFVSLIGYERPALRYAGDNAGYWPMHVEVNADWRQSGVVFDRQQPAHRAVRFEVIGCRTKTAAEALKSALEECLMGVERDRASAELRHHRFRNVVDFGDIDIWWPLLLADAVMRCSGGAIDMELFTRADHERRVAQEERRRMERVA